MKKRFYLCFVAIAVLLLTCTLCACDGSGAGTTALTGFDIVETEERSFGEFYDVASPVVRDAEGNLYAPAVTVTCDGETVAVISGRFQLTSTNDYIVTYTITVSEGEVYTKSTRIKVLDSDGPIVTFDQRAYYYELGATLEALPAASAIDNVDGALAVTTTLYFGENEVQAQSGGGYLLNTLGAYTLRAVATDSNGNVGSDTSALFVRNARQDYEVEAFSDQFGSFTGVANDAGFALESGYETAAVGGVTPASGRSFGWINAHDLDENIVKYPGVRLIPRITKAEALEATLDGYTSVSIRLMHTAPDPRNIYQRWMGIGAQRNLGAVQPNTWTTVTASIDDFTGGYDAIASGAQLLFYVGNDSEYVTQHDFRVYVAGIWITQALNVSFGANFARGTYYSGDTLSLGNIGLTAADNQSLPQEVDFRLTLTAPDGTTSNITDESSITFATYGVYRITATIDGETMTGSATRTVQVSATLNDVRARAAALAAVSDKTTATFQADALALSKMHDLLPDSDRESYTKWAMIQAVYSPSVVPDQALYFDKAAGLMQAAFKQTNVGAGNGPFVDFDGSLAYDTTTKYTGEDGSLLLTVGANRAYYVSLLLTGTQSILGNIDQYESLHFRVYANVTCGSNTTAWNIRLQNAAGASVLGTVLSSNPGNGSWVDVTIPLSSITSWDDMMISFRSANWSHFVAGSTFNISAVRAIPKRTLSFPNNFAARNYFTGNTVDLADMTAIASYKGEDVTSGISYTVLAPDAVEAASITPSGTYTFDAAGTYTFTVTVTGGGLDGMTATRTVEVKQAVDMSLQDVQALIAEMRAATDKTSVAYLENVENLQAGYYGLSDADQAQVDYNSYQAAITGMVEIVPFDSADGLSKIVYNVTSSNEVIIDPYPGAAGYTADVPLGLPEEYGPGATCFAPTGSNYLLMLDLTKLNAQLGDISRYGSLVFYAYRVSSDPFLVRGRPMSDYSAHQTINDFVGNTWNKITLDLSRYTSWSDVRIWFCDNTWNPKPATTYYISSLFATPKQVFGFDGTVALTYAPGTTYEQLGLTPGLLFGDRILEGEVTCTVTPAGGEPVAAAGYVFATPGLYTLTATGSDGTADPVQLTVRIVEFGEGPALFTTANAPLLRAGIYGCVPSVTESKTVGDRTDTFLTYNTAVDGTAQMYPGARVPLCLTKERLEALIEEGYTDISFDVYVDFTAGRYVYCKWSGAQKNVGLAAAGTWTTLTYTGAASLLLADYEGVMAGTYELLFVGNDARYTPDLTCSAFDVYFDNIVLSKPAATN